MTKLGDHHLPAEQSEKIAWETAQQMGQFTTFSLAAETHVPWLRVRRTYIPLWLRRGRIEKLGLGRKRRLIYRVTVAPSVVAVPPPMTADQSMWNTARRMGQFTADDIHMLSNTPSVPVDRKTADAFCARLMKAKYVRCLRKAIPGRQKALYFLHRETGPLAPVERRVRAIWDPNLKEFTHVSEPRT